MKVVSIMPCSTQGTYLLAYLFSLLIIEVQTIYTTLDSQKAFDSNDIPTKLLNE